MGAVASGPNFQGTFLSLNRGNPWAAAQLAKQGPSDGTNGDEHGECERTGLDQETNQDLDRNRHQECHHGAEQNGNRDNGQRRPRGEIPHGITTQLHRYWVTSTKAVINPSGLICHSDGAANASRFLAHIAEIKRQRCSGASSTTPERRASDEL